jgi:hypothetical protein
MKQALMPSIVNAVKTRIIRHGPGWCFTPKHFLDLNSDTGVRTALSRLEQEKMIRRLTQGVYDYPIQHEVLGLVPPDINLVAQAIAEKNGIKLQPSGAHAANLIGISEQVPGRVIFLSSGPSKKIKIGKTEILFRKATAKAMFPAGTKEGLVIQAFKFMKKENIDRVARGRTRKFLEGQSRKELSKNMKYAPAWIRSLVFEIMGDSLK